MEKRWQMFFYNLLVAQGIPQFPQRNFTGKKKKKGEHNTKQLFTHIISFLWLTG